MGKDGKKADDQGYVHQLEVIRRLFDNRFLSPRLDDTFELFNGATVFATRRTFG